MDTGEIKTEYGAIRISDKVMAEVARKVCLSVPGVAAMDARFTEVLPSVITGEDAEGVQISVEENEIRAELYFTVYYGLRVPDLAIKVQKEVKDALKEETGLSVAYVNVNIQDILFRKEERHG